ncbi:MAG: hypothetical protein K0Q79_2913 [Flavipsychrobacter sp.]|jgi:hypothetical protein|nr:hypothetical protein [Flavipsychrobacter sp.]
MKKYMVVSGSDIQELETEVTRLLNEGWELAGGISAAYKHEHGEGKHIPGHLAYAQAMIKEG